MEFWLCKSLDNPLEFKEQVKAELYADFSYLFSRIKRETQAEIWYLDLFSLPPLYSSVYYTNIMCTHRYIRGNHDMDVTKEVLTE